MSTEIDILNMQRGWLDKLQAISKKPILMKIKEGATPEGADPDEYMWVPYTELWHKVTCSIYTRSTLQNEIVIDSDLKDWKAMSSRISTINEYCKKENIPLVLAYSGGNGIHGHIFFDSFPIDDDNFKNAKQYDVDLYKIVRVILCDRILKGAGVTPESIALDTKKIRFSMFSKGSMVREFGTIRANGNSKTLLSIIPEQKPEPGTLPLVFPESVTLWTIPEAWNAEINEAIRQEIGKSISGNNLNFESITLAGNSDIEKAFPCINTLINHGSTKRYYAASSITLMASQCGLSWKETEASIRECYTHSDITKDEIELRINNVKSLYNGSHHFSCREVKETFGADICKFSKCVISGKVAKLTAEAEKKQEQETPKHILKRANEKLDNGTALNFLMENYQKLHIGDTITGKTVFAAIGAQSCINANGIQPKLSAGSGKGKSHAVSSCLHCVPHEFVLETSLSGKALFHSDDLKPGMLIFSDDTEPDEDLQEVIKRSSTNFQKITNHRISIKSGSEWTVVTKSIPPRTVWVLTSVNDNGNLEYLNRQLNLSVDESPDQDKRVVEKLLEKAEVGEIEFPVNDDVLVCREIIRDIKNKTFTVIIPYATQIEWADTENRRNLSQFLDLIRAFAVYNYRQRVKINETTIEAIREDFDTALSMYSKRANNQRFKLNDNELNILEKMVKDQPYKIEELQDILGKSYTTVRFLFHGRPGHENAGLLSKVPSLHYMPETEFLGTSKIVGNDEYEKELFETKKTRQKHVYVLTESFSIANLNSHGDIAGLRGT